MITRTRVWIPLLALALTTGLAATVRADYDNSGTSFQVSIGTRPHWRHVRGTRVMEVYGTDRPDYDMFRYGNRYYVYNNDHWYMSRRYNGRYMVVQDGTVPRDFHRVPREHWRTYPATWDNDNR